LPDEFDDVVGQPSDVFRRSGGAVHRAPGGMDTGRVRGLRALEVHRGVADINTDT
jgi:hypothetical protein